jgi:hypothetical protein
MSNVKTVNDQIAAALAEGLKDLKVAEPAVAEPAVAEPAVAEPAVAEPAVAEDTKSLTGSNSSSDKKKERKPCKFGDACKKIYVEEIGPNKFKMACTFYHTQARELLAKAKGVAPESTETPREKHDRLKKEVKTCEEKLKKAVDKLNEYEASLYSSAPAPAPVSAPFRGGRGRGVGHVSRGGRGRGRGRGASSEM